MRSRYIYISKLICFFGLHPNLFNKSTKFRGCFQHFTYIRRKNVIMSYMRALCAHINYKLLSTHVKYARNTSATTAAMRCSLAAKHLLIGIYIYVCELSVNIIMCCSLYRRTIMYRHINAWLITLHRAARYWNPRNNREFILLFNNFFKLFSNWVFLWNDFF